MSGTENPFIYTCHLTFHSVNWLCSVVSLVSLFNVLPFMDVWYRMTIHLHLQPNLSFCQLIVQCCQPGTSVQCVAIHGCLVQTANSFTFINQSSILSSSYLFL